MYAKLKSVDVSYIDTFNTFNAIMRSWFEVKYTCIVCNIVKWHIKNITNNLQYTQTALGVIGVDTGTSTRILHMQFLKFNVKY